MRTLALVGLLLSGCTWISSGALDCQLQLVDDDGDGYPLNEVEEGYEGNDRCGHLVAVDCDDADAAIHPTAEDAWYDGMDADCAANDDYDQDGDGYVLDEYAGLETGGVDGSGQLPSGDCDDTVAEVVPGAADTWYDGVDTDCSGNDDYDQDGDGYVQPEHEGLATAYVDGSGALPAGDCDDALDAVSPVATDTWYDGVDSDCGGNDDYDQDGDRYVPDAYVGLPTTYVDGSGALPGGDCDDEDRFIHADARDDWYDGVDSDCAGDDDFDQDVDGHRDQATTVDGDDCDDTDATSYPGATEVFGDAVDHDCDGGDDTFPLTDIAGMTWENPRAVQLVGDATHVMLALSVDHCTRTSSNYYDSAFALSLDPIDPASGFTSFEQWLTNVGDMGANTLSAGFDVALESSILFGVIGIETPTTRQTLLRARDTGTSATYGVNPPVIEPLGFDDATVAVSSTNVVHGVGCTVEDSSNSMSWLWADQTSFVASQVDDSSTFPLRARTCDLDFYAADGDGTLVLGRIDEVVAPDDTGDTGPAGTGEDILTLAVYTFPPPTGSDPATLTEVATFDGYDIASIQVHPYGTGRLLVLADATASTVYTLELDESWTLSEVFAWEFPAGTLLSAASVLAPDGTLFVSAATTMGDFALGWGVPGVSTELEQVLYEPGFAVDQTAVYVDEGGDLLVLAAAGNDGSADRVVWGYADLWE